MDAQPRGGRAGAGLQERSAAAALAFTQREQQHRRRDRGADRADHEPGRSGGAAGKGLGQNGQQRRAEAAQVAGRHGQGRGARRVAVGLSRSLQHGLRHHGADGAAADQAAQEHHRQAGRGRADQLPDGQHRKTKHHDPAAQHPGQTGEAQAAHCAAEQQQGGGRARLRGGAQAVFLQQHAQVGGRGVEQHRHQQRQQAAAQHDGLFEQRQHGAAGLPFGGVGGAARQAQQRERHARQRDQID